jgi:hypothetical protein
MRRTRGSETSQYPEEKKSKEIPSVAASERGGAQTDPNTEDAGVTLPVLPLRLRGGEGGVMIAASCVLGLGL